MVNEVQGNLPVDKCGFILDSGASDHLINDESLFIDSVNLVPPLKIAVAKQGEYIYASKRGIVRLRNDHEITLEDVLYCEQAAGNLMSVKRLQEAGMSVKFDKDGVTISKNGMTVVKNSEHVLKQDTGRRKPLQKKGTPLATVLQDVIID
ncbi:hypothetical protein KR059_011697 [Drosophila kikkawai]|nr:hypothetical protein KR059_011697 [Drosophila kikkawai]